MNNIEIIEYIEYISVRPKMYLIKYDYEELINHISYFISFKRIFDLITEKDILFLDKFPEWICKKYNYSIEKRSVWEKIIEIENPNNPMEIFFNEIDKNRTDAYFKNLKNRYEQMIEIKSENEEMFDKSKRVVINEIEVCKNILLKLLKEGKNKIINSI